MSGDTRIRRLAGGSMEWWKKAVIYQVYARSFQDSNGDGIGDIRGIIRRLDYLEWLGVDAIWLTPIFPSPMADFGYDISEFCNVDPVFGTLDDLDQLIAEIHRRGMRIVLDQVYHCTSSEHPWFLESRSSRHNPKSDWYIWKKPSADGGPPNNWLSFFSGTTAQSAWEWVPEREEYYLHLFGIGQCDLNLHQPEVQTEMERVMRFWLDRGVDGFRFDSISVFFKDPSYRDYPLRREAFSRSSFSVLSRFHVDSNLERPESLIALERMRTILNEYTPERIGIGESASERTIDAYFETSRPGRLNLTFNFAFLNAASDGLERTMSIVEETEHRFEDRAWPCYVLGHHDTQRLVSRLHRSGQVRTQLDFFGAAKVWATILLTLRGTPVLYYGEEIGMVDGEIPFDRILDPFGKAIWPEPGRDGCRTPMQWDNSAYCGFSSCVPWLPVLAGPNTTNVAVQRADDGSVLRWYQSVIQVRRTESALSEGVFRLLLVSNEIVAFERRTKDESIVVAVNNSDASHELPLRGTCGDLSSSHVLLGTHRPIGTQFVATSEDPDLAPWECVIVKW